jgi:hypothetical protein
MQKIDFCWVKDLCAFVHLKKSYDDLGSIGETDPARIMPLRWNQRLTRRVQQDGVIVL